MTCVQSGPLVPEDNRVSFDQLMEHIVTSAMNYVVSLLSISSQPIPLPFASVDRYV
jgi:hypothetical protein